MHAEPAVAALAVQQAGRNLVRLPDIGFRVGITTHCANNGQPESLSITIADTQRTLGAAELQAANTIDVDMLVPANQIAPLALQGFCVDTAAEGESVLIASALADDQTMVFAAEPLDIRLDCVLSADSTTEPAED